MEYLYGISKSSKTCLEPQPQSSIASHPNLPRSLAGLRSVGNVIRRSYFTEGTINTSFCLTLFLCFMLSNGKVEKKNHLGNHFDEILYIHIYLKTTFHIQERIVLDHDTILCDRTHWNSFLKQCREKYYTVQRIFFQFWNKICLFRLIGLYELLRTI